MPHQLSPTDLTERIRAIAEAAGVTTTVPAERCWVEARPCPYGFPEGTYVLRPEGFCHDGCQAYARHVIDPELEESEKAAAVHEHFRKHETGVVAELNARASELPDGPEAQVLSLAADILEEKKLDRHILLEDDLPKE